MAAQVQSERLQSALFFEALVASASRIDRCGPHSRQSLADGACGHQQATRMRPRWQAPGSRAQRCNVKGPAARAAGPFLCSCLARAMAVAGLCLALVCPPSRRHSICVRTKTKPRSGELRGSEQ
ncbi:hypothetical protein C2U31_27930 [Achromobacter sp. AONIH1]|nr:hypothetical protein C2U31_27930 [Achromobacter sp. AONIH1]